MRRWVLAFISLHCTTRSVHRNLCENDCADCSSLFLATHGDPSILEFIVSLIQILIHLGILWPPDSNNIPHVDFRPVAIYGNLGTCFMQQGNSATHKQTHGLQHIPIVCSAHNCCAWCWSVYKRKKSVIVSCCVNIQTCLTLYITHSGSQHYCNIEVCFMLICIITVYKRKNCVIESCCVNVQTCPQPIYHI